MENKNQEKELDLLDIINACWLFAVKYFFNPLIVVIKLGFKKWYILFISVIVGCLLSIVIPQCLLKKEKAEILVQSYVSNSSAYIKEIESLSAMNRNRLSVLLDVDSIKMKDLVEVRSHFVYATDTLSRNYFVDKEDEFKETPTDYTIIPNLFGLEVITKDTASLSYFTDAVLKYLNEKSSFAVMNNSRISIKRSELETFKNEAAVLDSLRYLKYFTNEANQVILGASGETFSMKDQNQWIQNDVIALKSRVIHLENQLKVDTLAVKGLTALTISDIYDNHPFKTFYKYVIICFLLTYLGIIVYTYRKNILQWLNKQ